MIRWITALVVVVSMWLVPALAEDKGVLEAEVSELIRRAASANDALDAARAAGDGTGMVDALSDLLETEQLLSRELQFVVRFLKLDDLREAANLARGNPDLIERIAEILPNSTRGASDGPQTQPLSVSSDEASIWTVEFEGNDIAMVYVRNAHPGGIRLSVHTAGHSEAICTSVVSKGWPVCAFTPKEEGEFEIRLESLNGQAQDVLVMVN